MREGIRAVVLAAALLCAVPAGANASVVLRVAHGHVARVQDRLAPPREALPPAVAGRRVRLARVAQIAGLTPAERARLNTALGQARAARDALPAGVPRSELAAVIATAESLDATGALTSSRLNAVELTLRRNTEFWPLSAPPAAGTRVTFAGSPLLFEYYPGQGLQLQPLGNFGKANAAWTTCNSKGDHTCTPLRTLLDAMLSLASVRGTFTASEYFFAFEGGAPPWISSMSQGTGIQALSRAYKLTGLTKYRDAATAAVGAFETPPPLGIARPVGTGTHYLMYSYAPDLFIFNGFLQSLVGLDDYRDITGDPRGTTLFRAGHANARAIVPLSDTGSWSLYSVGGPLSPLEYHVLLRDILNNLCKRTHSDTYCLTAATFTAYLAASPAGPPGAGAGTSPAS